MGTNSRTAKDQLTSFKVIIISVCWLLLMHPLIQAHLSKKNWVTDYNKRDQWQQPEKILDTIGIKPGMTVADVGAGTGYLTLRLARRVGEWGRVYATDIRRNRINILKRRAKKAGLNNILTVVGTKSDPGLPRQKIDLVIMLHVIHIVIKNQDPLPLLTNIKSALKPGGILALVHWDGPKMGYPEVEGYSKKSVLAVLKEAGFSLVRMETFLPRDTIFILKAD